ncbi:MAG: hypothetical protein KIT11_06345 [Fimbriimonadaceae bacterium]|nr:hypothetical protein [Fimbriimonadaceae bacterium]QYK55977.1 MAG: hypothetical protein KF733_00535 [Fimbriimonadaceae bacterium]
MVLLVEFDRFAEEVKRHCPRPLAYLTRLAGRTVASAAHPAANFLVRAETKMSLESAQFLLQEAGLEIGRGQWSPEEEAELLKVVRPVWFAAVAYKSSEDKPGLWVDATYHQPSGGEVVECLYREFSRDGVVKGVSVEEFIRIAEPNVVILDADEAHRFASENESAQPEESGPRDSG